MKFIDSAIKQEKLDLQANQALKQQAVDDAKQALELAKAELNTVNGELKDINDKLNQSNDDMDDLAALVEEKQHGLDDIHMNYIETHHDY